MRNVVPIFKKEMKSYFYSPIAYVVLTIFLALTGYLFFTNFAFFALVSRQAVQNPQLMRQLSVTDSVFTPLLGNMGIILLLMIPLLTMRLFAEEKKQGTMELLFTYPLRDSEILMGKFLACLAVYAIMLALTALYPLLMALFGQPDVGPILTGYLGLLLLGASFIAMGLLASSLTQNQIVAAVITFGVLLIIWVIGWASTYLGPSAGKILSHISLIEHLNNFSRGLINTKDLVYYLNFSAVCLFLTLRALESHRWKG